MPFDQIIPQDLPGLEPKTRLEVQRLFEHIYELAHGIEEAQRQLTTLINRPTLSESRVRDMIGSLVPPLIGGPQDPLLAEVGTGAGSVTSFSATPSSIFDVATPTSTPALSLDNQAANLVLAGPSSGGAATPSFRAIVMQDFPSTWTLHTPTITSGTGTITTLGTVSGRYIHINAKLIMFQLTISITTNGTAATSIIATLPFTSAAFAYIVIGIDNLTGKALRGYIAASGNNVQIKYTDNTYPGADSQVLYVSGLYELA